MPGQVRSNDRDSRLDPPTSFGDSTKVLIKGRGNICFSQKDGKEGIKKDVYYEPDLKNNILSMGQLLEKGYSIFMKDQILHLNDKKWTCSCKCGDDKESNVQTQLKEYIVGEFLL